MMFLAYLLYFQKVIFASKKYTTPAYIKSSYFYLFPKAQF